MNWELYRSIKGMSNKININRFDLQVLGRLWMVSDRWRHLRKHLGINASNYFLYDKRGLCAPPYPSLLKFRQLLHLNQAGV